MTVPYTPDHSADAAWDGYDPNIQANADALAWEALHYLTGGRVGNSAVRLRPCAARCSDGAWEPQMRNGEWYNVICQHTPTDCSCAALATLNVPTEVAEILTIWDDGASLTEGADWLGYNGYTKLVRLGGSDWPTCQDYTVAYNAAGALTIEYVPGVYPSSVGLVAAGTMASEFAKALTGGKCKLPSAITSLTRNGISLDYQEGYFPNNVTGMIVVDTYVSSLNPNSLRQSPVVWSPDLPGGMSQGV